MLGERRECSHGAVVPAAAVVAQAAPTPTIGIDIGLLNTMFTMLMNFMFFMLIFRLMSQMFESIGKAISPASAASAGI
jgi:hypothetical protein